MKKFYMLIAVFVFLANAFIVNAQIIYSNLDKELFQGNSFDLDLLKDAHPNDFTIRFDTVPGGHQVRVLTFHTAHQIIVLHDSIVKKLNLGDPINADQTIWSNNSLNWMVLKHKGDTNYGEFMEAENKFFGLKMYKNGDTYYGWVKVTIVSGTIQPYVKIHEMAYQKISDKGVTAGQTVGMNHIVFNQQNHLLKDRQLHILTERAEKVSISDISGHLIYNSDISSNKTINLSAYANGIYLIKITTPSGIITDKILLR